MQGVRGNFLLKEGRKREVPVWEVISFGVPGCSYGGIHGVGLLYLRGGGSGWGCNRGSWAVG